MMANPIPIALRTGRPVALCLTCAAECGQVYELRQRGLTRMDLCETCRRRRYVAKYTVKRKGSK